MKTSIPSHVHRTNIWHATASVVAMPVTAAAAAAKTFNVEELPIPGRVSVDDNTATWFSAQELVEVVRLHVDLLRSMVHQIKELVLFRFSPAELA